ncbi:MAG: glycine betaine ABC transporter substrate-binding protein [Rubrobacteraceae bacterium]
MVNKSLIKLAGLVAVLSLALAGCGSVVGGGGQAAGALADVDNSDFSYTVGSKDFTEQLILGQIAVQALEATGADVTDQTNLAGTDAVRSALVNGDIDMYWEYSGTNWINHLGNTDPVFPAEEQYRVAKEAELEENNIVLLDRAPFNNTYALAMRSEAPEEVPPLQDVTNLSDIGPLIQNNPDAATLCVESEFRSRDDGLPGMEEKYGYQFPEGNVFLFDTGVVYDRTDAGDPCNFGEVFTTDGRIAALDLTLIEDNEDFFPIYNPAINTRQEVYQENQEGLNNTFSPVAEAIDTQTMQQLNASVDVDGEAPEDVAQQWLQDQGFIE